MNRTVRQGASEVLGRLLSGVPLGAWKLAFPKDVLPVCYHVVSDSDIAHLKLYHYKSVSQFEADLLFAKSRCISYEELRAIRYGRIRDRPNQMFLTFDDGLAECFDTIRPLLLKHAIDAAFFVSTGFLDDAAIFAETEISLCIDAIEKTDDSHCAAVLASMFSGIPNVARFAGQMQSLRTRGSLSEVKSRLVLGLLSLDPSEVQARAFVCRSLGVDGATYVRQRPVFLTTQQVRDLALDGFTIGAHGVRHRSMVSMTESEILQEIVTSCQAVREITGQDRVSFAFPYNGLTIDRDFLATIKRDYPFVDLFFDSGMLRAEPSFVVNRVFADDPMGHNETTLEDVLTQAWAKPTSWYATRTMPSSEMTGGPDVACVSLATSKSRVTSAPISVVIPAYNAAQYLQETILSIRAQTVSVAEIIVVNDGSHDNTSAIARALGARVVEQENTGSAGARNHGALEATQPWIAFADADDPWESDKIERQWCSLERAPSAAFSFTDCSQFNEFGVINSSVMHEVHEHFFQSGHVSLGDETLLCDRSILGGALLVHNIFCHSALIVRTDTVRSISYDQSLRGAEDYDFVLRLMRDHIGTYVDVPLVRYRRHAMAQTSSVPKVWEGVYAVALRAILKPEEYSPQAAQHFARNLAYYLFRCGFAHFRYGEQRRARHWLVRSLQERITGVAIVLYPFTYLLDNAWGRWVRDRVVALTCCEAFKSRSFKRMLFSFVVTDKVSS